MSCRRPRLLARYCAGFDSWLGRRVSHRLQLRESQDDCHSARAGGKGFKWRWPSARNAGRHWIWDQSLCSGRGSSGRVRPGCPHSMLLRIPQPCATWQGIRGVCGFELHPGALGIVLQQAQPFQATACTLANQVDQIFQLAFIWRVAPAAHSCIRLR